MNPVAFSLATIFSTIIFFTFGFLIRQRAVSKLRKRMLDLENEMLANHEEILRLENALAKLEKSKHDIPIINMENNQSGSSKKATR